MSFCTNCGFQFSNGEKFCSNCGTRLSGNFQSVSSAPNNYAQSNYVPNNSAPNNYAQNNYAQNNYAQNNYAQNEAERELYTKNLIGYYKGPRQISGTFLVTNKKFTYTPIKMYLLDKPFTINMSEIANAERASVLGMNLCVRITTTSGKSHLFGFGIQNKNDIQNVVDLINSVKQGGRY